MHLSVFVSKRDCTGSDSLQEPLFAEFSINFVTSHVSVISIVCKLVEPEDYPPEVDVC